MKALVGIGLGVLWLAAAMPAAAAKPPRDILGIRIGMSEEAAEERLEKLGAKKPDREEEGEKEEGEVWTISHPRFAFVYLALDEDRRVRQVQAYARENAPRLRFRDLGDLKRAKRVGYYIYQWDGPVRDHEPQWIVTARSNDSVYVASVALASRRPAGRSERSEREREEAERRSAARRP